LAGAPFLLDLFPPPDCSSRFRFFLSTSFGMRSPFDLLTSGPERGCGVSSHRTVNVTEEVKLTTR
jgi:hypothetical protein